MNKLRCFLMLLLTVSFMGCAPMSKDSYIKKFGDFTKEVSRDCKSYDVDDWEKMSKKYDNFSGKWYDKYREEMSLKEILLVRSYQAKWYYNRGSSVLNDVVEVEKIIRFYVENDMQSDLQRLREEAHSIGGETEKTLNEILEKLDVQIE